MTTRAEDDLLAHVAAAFAELGNQVRAADPAHTPDAVTVVATRHVPGVDWASLTTLRKGRFSTLGATAPVAQKADELQYTLGSGPCVDAILDDNVYAPEDVMHDDRWPEFGRQVSELGVRSMLSFRLALDGDGVIAGMNLYSGRVGAFDPVSKRLGGLLAAHASLAVAAAMTQQKAEHLERALQSNRDIGVAMGVLMTRNGLTRQQAFDLLRVA